MHPRGFHLRIGHTRTLPTGATTLVPNALVNPTGAVKAAWNTNRSHYLVIDDHHPELASFAATDPPTPFR